MFSEFDRIQERMDKAYKQLFGGAPPGSPSFSSPFMEPPVDVYQTETEIVVLMEMAGIADAEVALEVEDGVLVIRGERKPPSARPRRVYSQMEISHGPFQRELTLPAPVNAEAAKAVYRDGILEIVLPKAAPTRHRQLRIVVR
jgi:HSP20 family protein